VIIFKPSTRSPGTKDRYCGAPAAAPSHLKRGTIKDSGSTPFVSGPMENQERAYVVINVTEVIGKT
jgi:hypothetical protein